MTILNHLWKALGNRHVQQHMSFSTYNSSRPGPPQSDLFSGRKRREWNFTKLNNLLPELTHLFLHLRPSVLGFKIALCLEHAVCQRIYHKIWLLRPSEGSS